MSNKEQFDVIEKIGNSLIQHGKINDRIYLMKLHSKDCPGIISDLIKIAAEKNYSKLFAKIPSQEKDLFIKEGFVEEASIPKFFGNMNDVSFMSKFIDIKRKHLDTEAKKTIDKNIAIALEKADDNKTNSSNLEVKILEKDDASQLVNIYKQVFETYPFPIHDESYIKETMDSNLKYYGIYENGILIAASSAEIDEKNKNAEMTDFAALPSARGKGLANILLKKMEQEMEQIGIYSLYTIARAHSVGMNVTFARAGYTYSGTLVNNTNISGKIESMNVWYKTLPV
ncbi:MAG: putative beta-lysine N-acetyltransferase [Melioribacteraceae bacterium]|nr:putative beta-lysine N-acetyltransferase [Melioribacteraceae bacterium]